VVAIFVRGTLTGFVPWNSAVENAKKNPIDWHKNFEFDGDCSSHQLKRERLQTTRKAHGASLRISPWLEHQRHPVQPQLLKKGRAK